MLDDLEKEQGGNKALSFLPPEKTAPFFRLPFFFALITQ